MTCKELTELLSSQVDGILDGARREASDRHLSHCPDCTAFRQSYRATMRMSAVTMRESARHRSEEIPDELVEAILVRLRA